MSETHSETASRVVVSHPSNLSKWGRDQLDGDPFRAYLHKVHDSLEPGTVWEEFVDVGCCGDSLDVPLRVETVDGPSVMGPDTEIEYTERDEDRVEGGWLVQSAAGPTDSQ
ncbi:MAG TPA: hypothetical protein VFJ06_14305 [Halococcus sp.]|jgi:hypothetical protein|nr:hypothetical protein [Halococcus sp.]